MADKDKRSEPIKLGESIPIGKAEGYKTLYVNASRMAVSPWDIRITLGQIVEHTPNGQINEDHVTLFMAPAQAKAFLHAFTITIQKYESMFGEINVYTAKIDETTGKAETKKS